MVNVFYTLFIYPISQIIELTYIAFDYAFYIHGLSIIGVSICITILCLPLYIVAEKWQQLERDTQKRLEPQIKRIKETFKGDEQYMMLTTYYKQQHYHPLMALRASFGLLIQVPFFMAAYIYLSALNTLEGTSFLFIPNLGAPDQLINLFGLRLNFMPIAMTLINVIASMVYTKGFKLKEKIPLYVMALLFLVILYDSPSGLVLYWTMNNIFSLLKNIYYKFNSPGKALHITVVAMIALIAFYFQYTRRGLLYSASLFAFAFIIAVFPFVYKRTKAFIKPFFKPLLENAKSRTILFLLSTLTMCFTIAFVSPSIVIASATQEFSYIDNISNPIFFVQNSLIQGFGLFVVWPVLVYFLYSKKVQSAISMLFAFCALGAILNTFVFPGHYGILSQILVYDNLTSFMEGNLTTIMNLVSIFLILAALLTLIRLHFCKVVSLVMGLLCFASFSLGISNVTKINNSFSKLNSRFESASMNDEEIEPIFHLVKNDPSDSSKKNVIVIMLDRAISGFMSVVLQEDEIATAGKINKLKEKGLSKEELCSIKSLRQKFQGFVYYPNTISFGFYTLQGAPAIFGGYEYSPKNLNDLKKWEKNKTLIQKHNEALAVMPRLFAQNGFTATVADAPWANYDWISDMSYMHDYPEEIKTYNTMRKYKLSWYKRNNEVIPNAMSNLNKRNFIWYGIMKAFPMPMRNIVYNNGSWWALASPDTMNNTFIDSYSVLDFMPELTDISNENGKAFIEIDNDTTHDPVLCQAPDFIPTSNLTDRGTSKYKADLHYHGFAAAMHRLSEWFEYLRQNDAYDNTKIIIVSDHGRDLNVNELFDEEEDLPFSRNLCNPILLVKDFNSSNDFRTDNTFMTNGDVPSIAAKDLIDDAKNPFTNKPLYDPKNKDFVLITNAKNWEATTQGTYKLNIDDDEWWTVKNNIFEEKNWKQVNLKDLAD